MSKRQAPDPRPEFAFIDWVSRHAIARPEIAVGIGDDAAVLKAGNRDWVSAVDVVTAGVHFATDAPLNLVGRKALAVNLSDLAAMAAEPCAAFIGIVLPSSLTRTDAETLYRGLFDLAQEWNVSIAGGDTNSWDGPLVLSVTVLGLTTQGRAVTRGGARPGDEIFVTGALGGSLRSGRHQTFTPRIAEALTLHDAVSLHAMLDVSDGLGSDLFHLLTQSEVGAILDGDAIPIHDDVDASLPPFERLQHALDDGEDFELLLTVSPEDGRRLVENNPLPIPLTRIGRVTEELDVRLNWQGQTLPLVRGGWAHRFGE